MNKKTFFISTAIDYPSEKPHLGHALEKIQADVLARYKRMEGFKVHFSTGTDEHGLKLQRKAEKARKSPRAFVDEMSEYFKRAWNLLNISYDDFIRTTQERHIKAVKEFIKRLYENGDIYKGKYKGLYCVDCETYYLPKDLKDGKCPIHKKEPEILEEETYFFRMSKYQKALIKHIKENKNFIVPETKRNEIIERLKEPLHDLSITRANVEWGIPFPFDKKLTLFVWVDALINYLTTIGYPRKKFQKFWPADIHVIGKDILWHHCVIWGSLLMSVGLPLPKTIFVHGFITVEGQKMSKSLGNIVNPLEIIEKYGADSLRYFLLVEAPPFEDLDFTFEKFKKRYNSDLASGLGNLVARIIALAKKSKVKSPKLQIEDKELKAEISKTKEKWKKSLEEFKFNEGLISIWELISFGDRYLEKKKPWELLKLKQKEAKPVISDLLSLLVEIDKLLEPFLPKTSKKILNQTKNPAKSEILFPKI